jgi:hypothetical protein
MFGSETVETENVVAVCIWNWVQGKSISYQLATAQVLASMYNDASVS